MIVAEQKPIEEIGAMLSGERKVLVLGCGTCVTVCMAGGAQEVGILASLLRLSHPQIEVAEATIERQCDAEFFDDVKERVLEADVVISMGCGVGVQMCAGLFEGKRVLPALNTEFFGVTESQGVWREYCAGCGECVLHLTGGICPIARCSKSLLNGPCGGSQRGMCEVDPQNMPCGWQLIYDRLKTLGRLDLLEVPMPLKDWSKARDGGVRTAQRKDVQL